ncbi:MAG: endopeptidase La [Lentisphaeria bacterium]|nr:endopeptidase La [Lentisphaeria bacterium]
MSRENEKGNAAKVPENAGNAQDQASLNITVQNEGLSSAEEQETFDHILPALSPAGIVVFPYALTPLVLDNADEIKPVEDSVGEDRMIAIFPEIAAKKDSEELQAVEVDVPSFTLHGKEVSSVGVTCRIVKILKFPDGTVRLLTRGLSRAKFLGFDKTNPHLAKVKKLETPPDNSIETIAMARNAVKQFQEVVSFTANFPEELKIAILNLTDNVRIVDLIADTINISYNEKLAILTIPDLQERLHLLTILLNREVEVLRLGSEIQTQVHNAMSKSQREFFLREQLKTIREQLGEGGGNPDTENFRERLKKKTLPDNVQKIVEKELDRMEQMPPSVAEYNVSCNYVDWILSLPWNESTPDRIDVQEAQKILDRDHFGLKDVKEKILEFLAVLQLKKDKKSPIICFVGPPGVGKTSLGKSIAEAMGRKFVRMSLGGVRDEAEIRGHRRTYVGALPGRIIQGLKKAGSANPVFMLDEIDKLGNDFRGDPASALLEVLDPQQNSAFNDHYLEVDYDLSTVMFITTANISDTIPAPLLDRMDVVRLPGYTANEKLHIAQQFLVPRQIRENGLEKARCGAEIQFLPEACEEIISFYTREAGVRTLERTIGTVLRKIAREIVEAKDAPIPNKLTNVVVDAKEVRRLLGAHKFLGDEMLPEPEVGSATGMAWTSVGGTILQVEASMMPGKGELKLTGSLGDVMKESAMAAFTFVRSHAQALKIDQKLFSEKDFHIHVPDGATPKDGPSAGVTISTALVSCLTGKKVRNDVSMTGEITLHGRVTAIGGVKEKSIGALRAGIHKIILPKENEKDLEEIPPEVLHEIDFTFVTGIEQVLEIMFAPPGTPLPRVKKKPPQKPAGRVAAGKKAGKKIPAKTVKKKEKTTTGKKAPAGGRKK